MRREELAVLLERYLDGALSQGEAQVLAEALGRDDDDARWLREELALMGLMGQAGERDAGRRFLESLHERMRAEDDGPSFAESLARRRTREPAARRRGGSTRLRVRRPKARRGVGVVVYVTLPLAAAALLLGVLSLSPRRSEPAGRRSPEIARDLGTRRDPPEPEPVDAPVAEPSDSVTPPPPSRVATAEEEVEPEALAPGPAIRPADDVPAVAAMPTETPAASDGETSVEPAARHLAYLDSSEGAVELARSGSTLWAKARAGVPLSAGDRLRAKLSRARIAFDSGSAVYVNHWTTLALAASTVAPGLELTAGEVYVETVEQDHGFRVGTPHGEAVDLGTRFGIEVKPAGTVVAVVEGKVRALTDKGRVDVPESHEVLLARRTDPPGEVRKAHNLALRLAWSGAVHPARVSGGLLALYFFDEAAGRTVRDRSGLRPPLDLTIVGEGFSWAADGGLSFLGDDHNTIATIGGPAPRLLDSLTRAGEITVEAWFDSRGPGHTRMDRIVVYDSPRGEADNARNFGLLVLERELELRLRKGGLAHSRLRTTNSPIDVAPRRYHVVCSYGRRHGFCIYVNGVLRAREPYSGAFPADGPGAWGSDYVLSVGNRTTSLDRDWQGTLYLVAVYNCEFSAAEVKRNLAAGPFPGRRSPHR